MAYAALEQSTTGQRPIWDTNALGQWVSWGSPALAHTYTGWWVGQPGGQKDPSLCLYLDLKVLVTEVDLALSRAPQTALFQTGMWPLPWFRTSNTAARKGSFCAREWVGLSLCFPMLHLEHCPSSSGCPQLMELGRTRPGSDQCREGTLRSPAPEEHSGELRPGPQKRWRAERASGWEGMGGTNVGLSSEKPRPLTRLYNRKINT